MHEHTPAVRTHAPRTAALFLALFSVLVTSPDLSAQLPLGSLIVSITSPAGGATVGGAVAVNASVSSVGGLIVRGVQFRLDDVNLGAEDVTAPYSIPWNTLAASNGSHTLTAIARDLAGLTYASQPVTVSVLNDLAPPTVSITAPVANAILTGQVTIVATASDNVGVAGVQFRIDGNAAGAEDTSAPFTFVWNTSSATSGSHSISAVARDAAGNMTTAVGVAVIVDNVAPATAVTAPASGASLAGTVSVTADASDNVAVAGVQFRLDGAALGGEDTSAPYAVQWNTTTAASGSHALTAVARDGAGNISTSVAVVVSVDNAPPAVQIASPAAGSTVAATVSVEATASDNGAIAGVQFKLDGVNLGAEDAAAPYAVSWDTTGAPNGTHTLTAVARDTSGNATTSAAVSVTVSNGSATVTRVEDSSSAIAYTGPWIQGNTSKPWSGGTAALGAGGPSATGDPTRGTLSFTGTAVQWIGFRGPQTGIAKVFLDGVLAATIDTYAPAEAVEVVLYSASGLSAGTHTIAVECTGTRNPSSSDIYVVIDAFDVTGSGSGGGPDTTPPTVTVSSPAAGATVSGMVAITAAASDAGGVAGVRFFVDGAPLQAEDTSAPYAVDWNTALVANGAHSLTAVARDLAGNSTTSAAVTVTVSNTQAPPAVAMTRFENTDAAIVYTAGSVVGAPPNWWHGSRSRGWSAETASFNRSEGARATFTFTGTGVAWVGFRASWAGIGRVYLDGAFAGEFDLYAPTEQPQSRVFSVSDLAPGTHTIVVESTGRKNASAADNAVVVDAFDVAPASAPPVYGSRIENTDPAMSFTAGWSPAGGSFSWSGGSALTSATSGARATVSFTGTTITLIGLRGPQTGIARVFLDGAFHAMVDTFSPSEIQAILFTDTNLAPGRHEMVVEVSGQKHAAATGYALVVDAFDVRSRFEEVDGAMAYTGTWVQNLDEAWSGTSANFGSGSAARSGTAGARATFSFSGTSVTLIGFRGPQTGIARVYLDGAFVTEVDTFAATKQVQAALFTAASLAPGPHTLAVEVSGLKNPASTNTFVFIDAFDVSLLATVPSIARFQQAAATYPAGVWDTSGTNQLYTGGNTGFASAAGAIAEFAFTGTGIRWVGQRAFDGGIARVYVDGVYVADVDTHAPVQEEFQAAMFIATGLSPGAHTLRIEVTGLKNASSTGTRILIDAFDVIQ